MKLKLMLLAATFCFSAAAHADMDFAIGMATGIPNGTVSGMVGAMLHDANEHAARDDDSTEPILNNQPQTVSQDTQPQTVSVQETPPPVKNKTHDWTAQVLGAGAIFLGAILMSVFRKRSKKKMNK